RLFRKASLAMPGVIILEADAFQSYEMAQVEMEVLNQQLVWKPEELAGVAMIVVADDAPFTAANIRNYVWVTYTRCNPSHDIHGIDAFTENKHWGCRGPLVIDARIKPHHAPPLEKDPAVEKRIDRLFEKGGSLYGIL
ncbi:MAG: 3-octaprenyl-4-hydroxybenzoate carboxy-lyase, partial [Bacteroidota bacterium]|nr:3-octaprenyl-4-hydroxybenzoate carboxy-lyase [Bacteroidota bacterium]